VSCTLRLSGSMRPVTPHWFLTNVRKTKLSSCRLCTSPISLLAKNRTKLPEVINFYNMSKGGVDYADQMIETYSSKFATRRWPVVLFCNLLDIAHDCGTQRLYVLFEKLKVDGAGKEKHRSFIKRLGKGLRQELQEQRRCDATLPSLVTAQLLDDTEGPPKKRGRCHVCPRETDKNAPAVCKACHKNVCHAHCQVFSTTCLSPN